MNDLRPEMLRCPSDDLAKLSLIDVTGRNVHNLLSPLQYFLEDGLDIANRETLLPPRGATAGAIRVVRYAGGQHASRATNASSSDAPVNVSG